jgi:rare lipoprotein A
MMSRYIQLLSIVLISVLIASCGTVVNKQDSAPKRAPDVSQIPDATPRDEPRSKYGNPAHYDVLGKRYYTMRESHGYVERGIASWYGTKFHGRRTSSGEPYDMYAMTAAHKTLPLPTYVEVTNLDNGRKVIVRVNDRGPFHDGRIIDLSYSAATKLGIIAKGTGRVEVRAISSSDAPKAVISEVKYPATDQLAGLYLQVGAFSTESSALNVKKQVQEKIGDAVVIISPSSSELPLYKVRVGPLANIEYGDSLANRLVGLGFSDVHIVVE